MSFPSPSSSFEAQIPSQVLPSSSASGPIVNPQESKKIASLTTKIANLEEQIREIEQKQKDVDGKLKNKDSQATVNEHIHLLHDYNEIRDIGQGLMGMIADSRGVRAVDVYKDFDVGEGD